MTAFDPNRTLRLDRRSALLAIALGCTFPASYVFSQQKRLPVVGYLTLASATSSRISRQAFEEGLRTLSRMPGMDVTIDYQYAESDVDRLANLAGELVQRKVDVIVATGTLPSLAAKKASSTIPIVARSSDPIGAGLVRSLAKPEGNVTGFSLMIQELAPKRLELFREAFPHVRRLGILWNALSGSLLDETEKKAHELGFNVIAIEVLNRADLEPALGRLEKAHIEGLFTFTSNLLTQNRKRIIEFAAQKRLPAIYHNRVFIEAGGLMFYGSNVMDLERRTAVYVDKILRGAQPRDLPIEQPSTFELVINAKTANALGLTIPKELLLRADEVIE